jgi:V/A-type H+-transporting ATPase subunit I
VALARMKKIFIVGLEDDKERALRFLQEAGALHVEPLAKMSGEAEKLYTSALQETKRVGQIYETLKVHQKREQKDKSSCPDEELLLQCEKALEVLHEVRNRKQALEKVISDLSVWGDFNPV